jgi:hypothetical protein
MTMLKTPIYVPHRIEPMLLPTKSRHRKPIPLNQHFFLALCQMVCEEDLNPDQVYRRMTHSLPANLYKALSLNPRPDYVYQALRLKNDIRISGDITVYGSHEKVKQEGQTLPRGTVMLKRVFSRTSTPTGQWYAVRLGDQRLSELDRVEVVRSEQGDIKYKAIIGWGFSADVQNEHVEEEITDLDQRQAHLSDIEAMAQLGIIFENYFQ